MTSVIYILWLRQIKRYLRSRSRIVGSLGQPLLFLLAFWLGFGPIYQAAGGGDYLSFLAPGIISMSIMTVAMFNGMEVIWDKRFGFLKETLVAPVSRLTIVIGRVLGGSTVALVQGLIVLLLTFVIGFRPILGFNLIAAIFFMFLVSLLFTIIGTAIASVLEDMHAFPVIMNFLIMPLFFLSGALFPLNGLPSYVMLAAKLNPLAYGVDGLRGALSGVSSLSLGYDAMILSVVIAMLFALCAWLFSRIEV